MNVVSGCSGNIERLSAVARYYSTRDWILCWTFLATSMSAIFSHCFQDYSQTAIFFSQLATGTRVQTIELGVASVTTVTQPRLTVFLSQFWHL